MVFFKYKLNTRGSRNCKQFDGDTSTSGQSTGLRVGYLGHSMNVRTSLGGMCFNNKYKENTNKLNSLVNRNLEYI